MHNCRQLLAAGLLFAASVGAPVEASRVAASARVPAPAAFTTSSSSATTQSVYLPLYARGNVAVDLSIERVELVQGVSMSHDYTVHVAGRPGLVRVYVTLNGEGSLEGVTARLTRYGSGEPPAEVTAAPVVLAAGNSTTAQGDLTQTFNFNLPAAWMTEDSGFVIEVDSANVVAETNEANNRYPSTGEQSFELTELADLEVVIVPVTYMRPGGTTTTPPVDDLSYLTWMPEKVLPLANIHYSVRATPYVFMGDLRTAAGWSQLLAAIDSIRATEDPSWNKLYYGLVDTAAAESCAGGCYTGLGYVNSAGRTVYKTAVGFAGFPGHREAASPTFTHEMGHNFGRRHAPCAGPSNVDSAYPYAGGSIGQWGYDLLEGALKAPGYKDYMSYCGPEWTSDYTYHGIAKAWSWLNAPLTGGAGGQASAGGQSLIVSGYIDADGTIQVEPVFAGTAPPAGGAKQTTHRLELVDSKGNVLAVRPFELAEIVLDAHPAHEADEDTHAKLEHGAQAASFRVAFETVTGLAGFRLYEGDTLLYERSVTGAAPQLQVATRLEASETPEAGTRTSWVAAGSANSVYRVRYSPDGGRTWHLLALAQAEAEVEVPAALAAGATEALLEVQASNGVQVDAQTYALAAP